MKIRRTTMEKKLITVIMAVVEKSNGEIVEYEIARKYGEQTFSEEEKRVALNKLPLGKRDIVCDVYEDYRKVWY